MPGRRRRRTGCATAALRSTASCSPTCGQGPEAEGQEHNCSGGRTIQTLKNVAGKTRRGGKWDDHVADAATSTTRVRTTEPVALQRVCENAEHTRSGLFHLSQSRSSVWSLHCKAVANYNSQIPFSNTVKQWRTLQQHALTSVDLPNTEFSLSSSFITEALLNSL